MISEFNRRFAIPSIDGDETVIYIGTSAGKQLREKLESAKKEILIISPYVSESYVGILRKRAKMGVDVKLVFEGSDKLDYLSESSKQILQSVITQQPFKNDEAVEEKTRKIKQLKVRENVGKVLIIAALVALICFIIWTGSTNSTQSHENSILTSDSIACNVEKQANDSVVVDYESRSCLGNANEPKFDVKVIINNYAFYSVAIIGLVVAFILWKRYSKNRQLELEKYKIYNYAYQADFEINCINNKDIFLHTKIFVIDNEIAYLGSINLTHSGFNKNFETRVCIRNQRVVSELREYALELIRFAKNNSYSTDVLGKYVYLERGY